MYVRRRSDVEHLLDTIPIEFVVDEIPREMTGPVMEISNRKPPCSP